jgi:hypothetical protein
MRRLPAAILAASVLCLAWVAIGSAESTQKGNVRVALSGKLSPHALPRKGSVPATVEIGWRISSTIGGNPPPLQRIELALNRFGHLDPRAVPTCRMSQIEPATTENAIRACRRALVGEGQFSAAVAISGQAPFPSKGAVTAFNGVEHGRPVILLHIYGTEPIPTSLTIPLQIQSGKGEFGTVLRGTLPSVEASIGIITGINLRLDGTVGQGGRHYLTAGCPAPKGFPGAVFALARGGFYFAHGKTLEIILNRNCHAIK